MKITSSVRMENFESGFQVQLENNLAILDELFSETATHIKNDAKNTAAFIDKTGNLRASIRKRKSKYIDGGYIIVASGKNKDKGYHAFLVEFGHAVAGSKTGKRVPPHPFLRPAAEAGRAYMASKIGSGR